MQATRTDTARTDTARTDTARLYQARPAVGHAAPASGRADAPRRLPDAARGAGRPAPEAATFRAHVTLRGAVAGMFLLSLAACLLSVWLNVGLLAGLGFCAACVVAPLYVRREAQLQVVASAPLIFLVAAIVTQTVTAQGTSSHGFVLSVLEGTLLMLASTALWLFAGTAACVCLAWRHGLPECWRELRSGLREARSDVR